MNKHNPELSIGLAAVALTFAVPCAKILARMTLDALDYLEDEAGAADAIGVQAGYLNLVEQDGRIMGINNTDYPVACCFQNNVSKFSGEGGMYYNSFTRPVLVEAHGQKDLTTHFNTYGASGMFANNQIKGEPEADDGVVAASLAIFMQYFSAKTLQALGPEVSLRVSKVDLGASGGFDLEASASLTGAAISFTTADGTRVSFAVKLTKLASDQASADDAVNVYRIVCPPGVYTSGVLSDFNLRLTGDEDQIEALCER